MFLLVWHGVFSSCLPGSSPAISPLAAHRQAGGNCAIAPPSVSFFLRSCPVNHSGLSRGIWAY